MRINTSHLRSIESANRNDFDELFNAVFTGINKSYVIRGFEVSMPGAILSSASGLTLLVADAAILHGNSATSGTFFLADSAALPESLNSASNTKVTGSFTPSSANYVTIELDRQADSDTSELTYFYDVSNNNETTRVVPQAQTLGYTIKISTIAPSINDLPIAVVNTNSSNNVESIEDVRPMLYRLGQGNLSPNPFYTFGWDKQTEGREENDYISTSSTINPFRGGDKQLGSMKDWMDSVMSVIKEMKGTVHWYDFNSGGSSVKLKQDTVNTIFTGRGSVSHNKTNAGQLNWDREIYMRVVSSRLFFKILPNVSSTDLTLTDGQVAYLDLARDQDISPNLVWTSGSPVVSSVGNIAWTDSSNLMLMAGDWIKLGSDDYTQYYQILSVDSPSQVTLTENFAGTSTGSAGAISKYSFGVYQSVISPSYNANGVSRHIFKAAKKDVPLREDIFWLFFRDDVSGYKPKIYSRMSGTELDQGSSTVISDDLTQNILNYIGATSSASGGPDYDSSLSTNEVSKICLDSGSTITSGQYFLINDQVNAFYVWFNVDSLGGDPLVAGKTAIPVSILSTDTELQVADKLSTAFNGTVHFVSSRTNNVLMVTSATAGSAVDGSNVNVGGAFYIKTVTQGETFTKSGQTSYSSINEEDLTVRAAKLTAMIADKAQDKTVQILPDYNICTNTANGLAQELMFSSSGTNTLTVAIPSSDFNGVIGLGSQLSLLANQVAYFEIDRNHSFTISDLSGLTVADFATVPLNENVFIFAYRLATNKVWLWNGEMLNVGDNYPANAMNDILTANCYEEPMAITAPVSSGSILTLPNDSRNSGNPKSYVVGQGALYIEQNGIGLVEGVDWEEIGALESASNQIRILVDLEVNEQLKFRIDTAGGYFGTGSGGGGTVNSASNVGTGTGIFKQLVGTDLEFKTLKSGTNVSISSDVTSVTISSTAVAGSLSGYMVNNADYTITDIDGYGVILATTGNFDRVITLPVAANNSGRIIHVKKIDSGAGFVNIRGTNLEFIDDKSGPTYDLFVNQIQAQWTNFTFFCSNGQWWRL